MKIYFLSGLGADSTFFRSLDLSFCEPVFIDWISPHRNESLESYAARIKEQFIEDDAVIVGLSFGGMLATEIAKQHPAVKSILVSSAKTKHEIPSLYRTGKYFPVQDIAPAVLQRWFMLRMKGRLGIKTAEEKKLFADLIKRNNKAFNSWAINALIRWRNEMIPENIVHIHGTHDKVLPYKLVKADYSIHGGEHLMIMSKAAAIAPIIRLHAVQHAATFRQALSS